MAIAATMDFVGNVDGSASVFGDGECVFLLWLEVPDGVVELWVLGQLCSAERCHGVTMG